jgi:anti-anti-sigma factor
VAAGLGVEVVDVGPPAIVVVRGEVDVATSPELDAVVAALDVGDIVLDLAGVTFMASSGLASLLRADRHAIEHGGRLTLRTPSRQVREVLDMTHLLDRFTIEDSAS